MQEDKYLCTHYKTTHFETWYTGTSRNVKTEAGLTLRFMEHNTVFAIYSKNIVFGADR